LLTSILKIQLPTSLFSLLSSYFATCAFFFFLYNKTVMAKSYLIGLINILAGISLAAVLGVLLIFQVTSYQYNVSFKPSLSFFLFDLFGTKLFILIIIAMLTNFFSAVVMLSGLFSNKGFTLSFIASLLTLLWIVLFLG